MTQLELVTAVAFKRVMFGREAELATVAGFIERVPSGPGALVLEGEAGIGKTTVWRAGVDAANDRSYRVLACRPAEAEARLSYSGLSDLLRPVCGTILPRLPGPQRSALETALLEKGPGERPPDRRTVSISALNALRAASSDRCLLVAIDDVQWLDVATRRVLEYAVRRLRDERIGVLVSLRSSGSTTSGLETFDEAHIERVRLGPLSISALHHLVRDRTRISLPRPMLIRIHTLSAGNPFYALEIARLLAEDEATARDRLPVPEQVKALVTARLNKLPARTRGALLQAAALSRPHLELLDADALAPAEDAGVVSVHADGRIVFAHPLFASAVYDDATPSLRRNLHRRLANLAPEIEERARHLALATTMPDAGAAELLRTAAERALARGAPEAAAELFEQAKRLSPNGDVQMRCAISAAECHLKIGDMQRASDLLTDAVTTLSPGGLRARALWRLADVRLYQDDFPEAVALLEQARAEAVDDALAADIELDLAYAHNCVGDMTAADPHAREAARLARRIDQPGLLAEALAVSTMSACLLGRGVDWHQLDHALALEDWSRPSLYAVRPTLIAALLHSWTGNLEEGAHLFDELERQLLEMGDEAGYVMGTFFRAAPDTWRGDVRGACRRADQLLEQATVLGGDAARAAALAAATFAHAYAGDTARVRAEAAEALEIFARVGWAVGRAWPSMALAHLELSLGNAAAAEQVLSPLVAFMRQVGLAEPWGAAPFLPDAIEALLRLGRNTEAETMLDDLEAAAQRLDRTPALAAAARCRALLHAEAGQLDAATSAVNQAMAHHAQVPMPVERARTLLVRGQLARRARRRREAYESFEQALRIFEQTGARLWAVQARRELERTRVRRKPGDELSETERRVAHLAATGLTNREVAKQLFVSPKTVEANLARAYQKLGVHSRAELGALLASVQASVDTSGTDRA